MKQLLLTLKSKRMKKLIISVIFTFSLLNANAQLPFEWVCNIDSPWGSMSNGNRWTVPVFADGKADIRHNQEIALFDNIWNDSQEFVFTFLGLSKERARYLAQIGEGGNAALNYPIVIRSAANTDYVVTILDGKFTEGQPIVWQKYRGAKSQQWKIKKDGYVGNFYIVSVQNPNFCIKTNSTGDRANPVIERHQRLKLHRLGNLGMYEKNAQWDFLNVKDW